MYGKILTSGIDDHWTLLNRWRKSKDWYQTSANDIQKFFDNLTDIKRRWSSFCCFNTAYESVIGFDGSFEVFECDQVSMI